MNCTLPRPPADVLFKRHLDMFSVDVLGGSPIIPESNEWYAASLTYAIASEFYAISAQQWAETDPRKACCDNLISMAANDGMYPRAAQFSTGYVKITGVPGTLMPRLLQISFGKGFYRSVSVVPSRMSASGEYIGRFRAVSPGPDYNNPGANSTTGTLVDSVTGLNKTVTVYGGNFCNGAVAETCEEFRTRYLDRLKYAPVANAVWLKNKIIEWPCVTRVVNRGGNCCVPDATGCPSCSNVDTFYALFDNTFDCGIAPQCVIDELNEWLFGPADAPGAGEGEAPICVRGKIYTAIAAMIDIVVSNSECISVDQKNEISNRIYDYFKRIAPSTDISVSVLESIALQVTGETNPVSISVSSTSIGVRPIEYCSDLEVDCDYLPCVNSITFLNEPEKSQC